MSDDEKDMPDSFRAIRAAEAKRLGINVEELQGCLDKKMRAAIEKAIVNVASERGMTVDEFLAHMEEEAEFDRKLTEFMRRCGVEVRGRWQAALAARDGLRVRAALDSDWAPGPRNQTPAVDRRKLKALKDEVRGRWPTVERDFRDSDANGLKAAAKLADDHGYWDLAAALLWAKANGKLANAEAREIDPLEAFNRRRR